MAAAWLAAFGDQVVRRQVERKIAQARETRQLLGRRLETAALAGDLDEARIALHRASLVAGELHLQLRWIEGAIETELARQRREQAG